MLSLCFSYIRNSHNLKTSPRLILFYVCTLRLLSITWIKLPLWCGLCVPKAGRYLSFPSDIAMPLLQLWICTRFLPKDAHSICIHAKKLKPKCMINSALVKETMVLPKNGILNWHFKKSSNRIPTDMRKIHTQQTRHIFIKKLPVKFFVTLSPFLLCAF